MCPTRSTPCDARSNTWAATIASAATTSDAGSAGTALRRPRTPARERSPTSTVAPLASPRLVTMCQSFSKKSPEPLLMPRRAGTWPTMIVSARPTMKPFSTGSEMRLATKPRRARPATRPMTPAVIASAIVSSVNLGVPCVAITATVAAESAAVADIGPTTRCLELPKAAYSSSAAGAAYRPVTGGTPAITA